jgi:hypothetical protein
VADAANRLVVVKAGGEEPGVPSSSEAGEGDAELAFEPKSKSKSKRKRRTGRVGHPPLFMFSHTAFCVKTLVTASMVRVTNLIPPGSECNPGRAYGQNTVQLRTAGMVHVTSLTPGSGGNATSRREHAARQGHRGRDGDRRRQGRAGQAESSSPTA